MKLERDVFEALKVKAGEEARLSARSTTSSGAPSSGSKVVSAREIAEKDLQASVERLERAQELLFASRSHAVLVVMQALDAAGKDGTIKHVMSGVNPQGCDVVAFKAPTELEAGHDFLWRTARVLPERGRIGIFNRSYYEEVLVVRVHPELLATEHVDFDPRHKHELWQQRFEDINAFERHLDRNATKIVKFFLHVSRDEQKKRLLERLEDPSKYWKFSSTDLQERARWDDYEQAYEEMLTATSSSFAPWYVIPADHKYVMRALVGAILTDVIEGLDMSMPPVSTERLAEIAAARASLKAEGKAS